MNASIDLLLDKAGLAGAQLWDFREGARDVFSPFGPIPTG